jgi:hypothetical protein
MDKISDEMISAWLDRECSVEQGAEIEAAVAWDPLLALRVARLARLDRVLAPAYSDTLNASVPDRFETLLASPKNQANLRGLWSALSGLLSPGPVLAFGASLAVAAVAGGVLFSGLNGSPGFETTPEGAVIANGELSAHLAELASGGDGAIRVKLSLRDEAGRFCRQFETSAAAGLACFESGDWRLESLSGGRNATSSGSYVMAEGGVDPGTTAALERIGISEVLDREHEARAIANGWK